MELQLYDLNVAIMIFKSIHVIVLNFIELYILVKKEWCRIIYLYILYTIKLIES